MHLFKPAIKPQTRALAIKAAFRVIICTAETLAETELADRTGW